MSGVFGAYGKPGKRVLEEIYLGLYALQHRGQESAGIAWINNGNISAMRGMGLLHNAVDQNKLAEIDINYAVGHVRYMPIIGSQPHNILPIGAKYARGPIAISHDGRITNLPELTKQLELHGAIFESTTDSEAIAHLMAQKSHMQPLDALVDALRKIQGSYAMAVLLENGLVAARDPWGFRPLVLGKRDLTYYVASESCALDIIGAKLIRDVEPGEVLLINEHGIRSIKLSHHTDCRMTCSFEYVYTARPDSIIDGHSVYEARKEMGRRLAISAPCTDSDFVSGMPDSGTIAGIGYAEETKCPFETAIVRNRYVGRTFIQPTQKVRDLGVKMKLNPISEVFKDKNVVIVDDSIVRGTTAGRIVKLIRESGAKEVHMRIASPPVRFPCPYGIDTRKKGTLAAVQMTLDQLCEKINATSLCYLSSDDLVAAIGLPEDQLCTACFTGRYLKEKTKENL